MYNSLTCARIVADDDKNTQELKSVSELDEEAKEIVKDVLISTMSSNVSAVKPSKCQLDVPRTSPTVVISPDVGHLRSDFFHLLLWKR